MLSLSPVSFSIIFALLFFALTCAEEIDPLSELDVMVRLRLNNRPQCQRLCWYWKACGRYSFYDNNDHNSRDNCVLHGGRQHNRVNLVSGWTDEEASEHDLSPSNGCTDRPCSKEEMCTPVFPGTEFTCIHMNSDAWLGQNCTGACQSPPSAGNTTCFHGQCLCAAGHFYSESRLTCLPVCTQLGHSYLRYERYDLFGHDAYIWRNVSDIAVCKAICSSDPACFTIVYIRPHHICHFKSSTALLNPKDWKPNRSVDSYQRTCLNSEL